MPIDSGTVIATAAVLSLIGAAFLWVMTMVVQASISKAINGFATRVALLENQYKSLSEQVEKDSVYAHGVMHDGINKLIKLQTEAFNFGVEMGRKDRKDTDR